MTVPRRYLVHQLPVLRALVQTAIASSGPRPGKSALPGPVLSAAVSPRPERLVQDYIRAVGGEPSAYRGVLPAHLFPQWGFPLLAKTLLTIPYDLKRVLNGGCRIEMHRALPANEPLQLEAWLEDIDDNGSRAVIKNRLRTSTASAPNAVDAWMYAVVPLKKGEKASTSRSSAGVHPEGLEREKMSTERSSAGVHPSGRAPSASSRSSAEVHPEGLEREKANTEGLEREKANTEGLAHEKASTEGLEREKVSKERPRVPDDVRELAWWTLRPSDAVDFAFLTGDFNPVHWSATYARAAGFKSTILHGFATLALAIEALNRNRFAGDPSRIAVIDVKFVRPLVLPADVGVYTRAREIYVGTAPGGPCYLTGTFEERIDG